MWPFLSLAVPLEQALPPQMVLGKRLQPVATRSRGRGGQRPAELEPVNSVSPDLRAEPGFVALPVISPSSKSAELLVFVKSACHSTSCRRSMHLCRLTCDIKREGTITNLTLSTACTGKSCLGPSAPRRPPPQQSQLSILASVLLCGVPALCSPQWACTFATHEREVRAHQPPFWCLLRRTLGSPPDILSQTL
ncbi:Hypothetical predicted protein [Marmota monax]|uniref:Uncharacterized protein n=1 Tax=Marmota monax TaxID=9995 RepID=A0A5E4AQM2_MARMO|nr:Hypothetical predicted protein [Marmota monax]